MVACGYTNEPEGFNVQDERHDATAELLDSLSKVIRTSRALSHGSRSNYGFSGTPVGILKILGAGDARAGISPGFAGCALSRVLRARPA
jgi:hypothetical protein